MDASDQERTNPFSDPRATKREPPLPDLRVCDREPPCPPRANVFQGPPVGEKEPRPANRLPALTDGTSFPKGAGVRATGPRAVARLPGLRGCLGLRRAPTVTVTRERLMTALRPTEKPIAESPEICYQ